MLTYKSLIVILFIHVKCSYSFVTALSHEQNLQKMRLLTFMQMAETRKEIPFSVIESELQLKPDEVEGFIIDGKFNLAYYVSLHSNLELLIMIEC